MNLQAQMAGQFSRQVPNQGGSSLLSIPQRQNIMQSSEGPLAPLNTEHSFLKTRQSIHDRIYEILLRRQQTREITPKNMSDIVRRLEEGLFRTATSKEEYVNLETLEKRLHDLIRRPPYNHNQRYNQQSNVSVAMGTMIPTPGMPQSGNSSLMVPSSTDSSLVGANGGNNMVSPAVNAGNFPLNATGPSRGMQRDSYNGLIDGYQQASNVSISSGGNNFISSTGGQQMGSQMMPTPGYSNSTSNQSYTKLEPTSNVSVLSSADSTMISQPMQQKQQVGGQNSSILQSVRSHMGGGNLSTMNDKAYGFSNGPLNGNLGMMAKSSQMTDSFGASEGFLTDPHYGNSPKPVTQYFDQHQGQISQGDGNFSSTSPMNIKQVNLSASHRTSSSLVVNQSNFLNAEQAGNMNFSADQYEEMDFRSQQQPLHFQQQLLRSQRQQNQQDQRLPYWQSSMISDSGGQIKSEPGMEHGNGTFQPQAYEHFQSSQATNSLQQNSGEAGQLPGLSSGSQGIDNRNGHTHMIGNQPVAAVHQGQWHSRSQQASHEMGNSSNQLNIIQEEFRQGMSGHDQVQRNNLSSEASMIRQTAAKKTVDPPSTGAVCRSANLDRELQFKNQQRWLLLLRHARRCDYPPGNCPEVNCITVQKLLKHMMSCNDVAQCKYARCQRTKMLVHHHKQCRNQSCPVCIPVKLFVQRKGSHYRNLPQSGNKSCDYSADASGRYAPRTSPSVIETSEDVHPSQKRIKIEQLCQSLAAENENPRIPVSISRNSENFHDVDGCEHQVNDTNAPLKYEVTGVRMEVSAKVSPKMTEARKDYVEHFVQKTGGVSEMSNEATGFAKVEFVKTEQEVGRANQESVALPAETSGGTKSRKPKIKGVSMIELFTPEQIREHIAGLRKWVGQSKAKAEKNQAMEHSMNENSCQLCAVEKLKFEPPPIYCSPCGSRIKRNAMFYTIGSVDARYYFCIPCYNENRGDTIHFEGTKISKARLEKKKNDEDTEEPWVQCDKCEAWQHQVCALFNSRRNDGGQAEYTCPNCYMEEVERGERVPLPQSTLLGAKDLPRTILSDHLENRLVKSLKQERLKRAAFYGKSYDEVPGAEYLVVRVVSSVDKKLEVKQRFLEIFQEENYASEFAYKSKVVLLFQKIEGVEVCLFGMYVQEFGTECEQPNHRRVYLSYLDSVKYFRPEIRTTTGEALRTFVYQEILIGYLEYCKLRGFTSCYIWACPPLKGEDYILYCHPEIQKTPKSDKLREWYLSMLRKASKEDIVVGLTNLYDHFFVSSGECKAKVTATRLPYFDGDYWPGAAEDVISQLHQEEEGRKLNKKGFMKRTITKRALKASGQIDLSGNVSKDLLLMHRLGETISPMKEDFIMVHLQHACTHCRTLMVSGKRWVCDICKNFQLCDACYEIEENIEEQERHPINQRVKHPLYPKEINYVPTDTKDKDEILESEFFDTRQAFLSLCQGNHYQYDTLRRAKHSSMMVLYHLHNPTAPAFVLACCECRNDIESGEGWRCEICPEYDVCNSCYQKDSGMNHPHKLIAHPSIAERDAQNKEARQLRVAHFRKMLDLLVHAAECRSPQCKYPNCRKVKGLFRHGMHCKVRAAGGCGLCKKMWHLLQLHARQCKDTPCNVPRCRDLREHLRRLTQQADSRRRAAVMEMMRQRAAEASGSSG